MTTLLDTHQAALRLGLARATLAKYRVVGGGPPFVKIGAKVLYPLAALDEWLDAKPLQASTSDTGEQRPGPSAEERQSSRPSRRSTTGRRNA
jgi:predicted DNA-binding transcriptional regulator AlpA